jgi:hypothetical protein
MATKKIRQFIFSLLFLLDPGSTLVGKGIQGGFGVSQQKQKLSDSELLGSHS